MKQNQSLKSQQILKKYFGYDNFREGQVELIEAIASGRDVLGIMPTGAGKSLCYQVPALMSDEREITLVISPLISLMKDQVAALLQAGVAAAFINSSLAAKEYFEVLRKAQAGEYVLIYVAPERLLSPDFLEFCGQCKIKMITIDEAHCLSQWGQDFRPSYLKIMEFVSLLNYRPIISAFTATATTEVKNDILRILNLNNPLIVTTGFDRQNLFFEVQRPTKKMPALLNFLHSPENKNKSGIIYCSTRKSVDEVCQKLLELDFVVTKYHAGLADEERKQNQEDFIYNTKQIIVATNAFGMGIDKSNVSFVVHYNMPKNLESYYQEAGRAGRDGEPANCLLLYAAGDVATNKFLISHSNDSGETKGKLSSEQLRIKDLELLKHMTVYSNTLNCLRAFILNYFGEKIETHCGKCANCQAAFETVEITLEAQKILSCVYRIEQTGRSFGKIMIADILWGSKNKKIRDSNLEKLSTYGLMKDMSSVKIKSIIDYLLSEGYLMSTESEYPMIKLGEKAGEILYEKQKLMMKTVVEIEIVKKGKNNLEEMESLSSQLTDINGQKITGVRKKKLMINIDSDLTEKEQILFEKLRELRFRIAKEEAVPSYIVFSDATLKDMCRKMPINESGFLGVSGVGLQKLEKYGERFLTAINKT